MGVRISLTRAIYPQECIEVAAEAFAPLCSVGLRNITDLICTIEVTTLADVDETQAVHEFLNYVLDLSLETHLNFECRNR
jgi:hypothetical protein